MTVPVIPVSNGVFPRPGSRSINGILLDSYGMRAQAVSDVCFLCPPTLDGRRIYPVGVLAAFGKRRLIEVYVGSSMHKRTVLAIEFQGLERARVGTLVVSKGILWGQDITELNLSKLKEEGYPCIDGAGWRADSGRTIMKGIGDVPVQIEGSEHGTGRQVSITANLGEIVEPAQAHTIEHAIIRSLQSLGICTPKSLIECIKIETDALKASVEIGYRLRRPEVFGITDTGMCGNPLTQMAQVYMIQEIQELIEEESFDLSGLQKARNRTLSRLFSELDISMEKGLRVLQGLKTGMMHEDFSPPPSLAKAILHRFPLSPWDSKAEGA